MKKSFPGKTWLFPRPVLLITATDSAGHDNIVTVSWAGIVCSEPPLLGIALRPSRYSHQLISASKEFAVNIPNSRLIEAVELCGVKSGRNTDKFKELSLTKERALKISAPLIKECPINLECAVHTVLKLGTHDLFVAEIIQSHAAESLLKSNGDIDDWLLDLISWQTSHYFNLKPINY